MPLPRSLTRPSRRPSITLARTRLSCAPWTVMPCRLPVSRLFSTRAPVAVRASFTPESISAPSSPEPRISSPRKTAPSPVTVTTLPRPLPSITAPGRPSSVSGRSIVTGPWCRPGDRISTSPGAAPAIAGSSAPAPASTTRVVAAAPQGATPSASARTRRRRGRRIIVRPPAVRRTSGRASPCGARGRTTGSSTSRRPAAPP